LFSGIVEEVGVVVEVKDRGDGKTFVFEAAETTNGLTVGESVSVSGVCLTAVNVEGKRFSADVMFESLRRTKLNELKVGSKVNLERALRFSDRLGGHLVSGHVDALAKVSSIVEDGFSHLITFELDPQWAPYFVEKGSVAVDGVSLTVVNCDPVNDKKFTFSVGLIPHTMQATTLGALEGGAVVNVETDIIARYVVRLLKGARPLQAAGYPDNLEALMSMT